MTAAVTTAVKRYQPVLTALALACLAVLLSAPYLQWVPVYLHHDEVLYALHAHSIAATGHDLNGLRLPLFIHTFAWVPPLAIYVRAVMFRFVPLSEVTTRIPGVVVGAVDVVLTYTVARRLFQREGLAILSALLVLLTPIHFIHARLGGDHLYGVPFVIAFVLFVINFIERRTPRSLFAAHACLGLAIYGYIGATTSVPVYAALTCALLFFVLEIRTPRPYLAVVAGLILSFLPLVPWLLAHPEHITDQLKVYDVARPASGTPAPRVEAIARSGVVARIDDYYEFFDPETLFFFGDQHLADSTRQVGVFLLPLAVLLPAGAYYILKHRRTPADVFVLLGFLVAPIGALIVDEVKLTRVLIIVPFAAFVAARGVDALVRMPRVWWRVVAIGLLLGTLVQFQQFYRDYFTGYRERSSVWFGGNRGGAIEALLARADRTPPPALYVSREIPMVQYFWQFYLIKDNRTDLTSRVVYFDESLDVGGLPAGSVLLSAYTSEHEGVLDRSPALKRVMVIRDADTHPSFAIYEK